MADFIPINSVCSGAGIDHDFGEGGATVAVAYRVTMSDYYHASDGDVYFAARLYFADDEKDSDNHVTMSGGDYDNGGDDDGDYGYDFPDAKRSDYNLGFKLKADGTDKPQIVRRQGGSHKTDDHKTFTLLANVPEVPVYAVFVVYKPNGYNDKGRFSSIYHYEETSYKMTTAERLAALQHRLDAEYRER